MNRGRCAVIAGMLLGAALRAGAQPADTVARLMRDPSVTAALDAVRNGEPQTIEEQIRICEVAAPPFQERARGELLRQSFQQLGLEQVRVDSAGNVVGERPGASARPALVISAHLDTVFPEGTDVRVTRQGPVLHGPGIGDNCRGLAVLLAVARAMNQAAVRTPGTVIFAATVGEEGLGDLRGVKTLFGDTLKGRVDAFVSIDNGGSGVSVVGVGSRRYRVTFKGPGGHSFAQFGTANPANALGRAIARIAEIQAPASPRTTFNVGRIGGGTSVNAIPTEAWMEIDLRSSDPAELTALEAKVFKAIETARVDENARWGGAAAITVTRQLVGDRPAGATGANAPIVQAAQAAARAVGLNATLTEGSSDANLPMSLRIPAIAVGGGGVAANTHAPDERFDSTGSWRGTQSVLLLTIALAR